MKNEKIYENYKKKADFLLNFQLCRAFLGENCGVSRIVEIILSNKFRNQLAGDDKGMGHFLREVRAADGRRDAVINLPRLEFKDTVRNILSSFVESKFDKMVAAVQIRLGNYPISFRDMVERYG